MKRSSHYGKVLFRFGDRSLLLFERRLASGDGSGRGGEICLGGFLFISRDLVILVRVVARILRNQSALVNMVCARSMSRLRNGEIGTFGIHAYIAQDRPVRSED